jgi:hypothetical protein
MAILLDMSFIGGELQKKRRDMLVIRKKNNTFALQKAINL